MMDEYLGMLARQAGIDDVDIRKLRVFADMVIADKGKEIEVLKDELYIARAQNELYNSIVNGSF